jgi:hypothetical protein
MTTEPPSPPGDNEKLAATLAALEAERATRVQAGKWSRGTRPVLMAVPQAGETLQAAQQRAVYQYLADHPDAPKSVSAYNWFEIEVLDPPPIIEAPSEQWAPHHADAVDVTPPWPRPLPPPSPPPARPIVNNNAGIPPRIHARSLKQLANFESDVYDPADAPLRYPRGRNGW